MHSNGTSQKIIPHLWFDDQAEEAAQLYTSLFDGSGIETVTRYSEAGRDIHGQPEGKVMTVSYSLGGYRFAAINGGPHFRFTPAISFFVVAESEQEVDRLWEALSEDGSVLMPLDAYDWSEKYGWVADRYGLTWQISLGSIDDVGQKITPSLLFVGEQNGRAEEAVNLYTSAFPESSVAGILRYGPEHEHPGTVTHAQFSLHGEVFMAMDGGMDHDFTFTEAVSLLIACESQDEIDHYWEKLTDGGDPEAQQCGWLKDRFGVSWQVAPTVLLEMLQDSDREKVERVTNAFMKMKKFDIDDLEKAFAGA